MREKIAIKSSFISLISQLATLVLSLICTKYFLVNLGLELRGINGLFTNCLSLLQLAELGVGSAITYALYDPIVKKNMQEVKLLLKFYKRAYIVIGIIIMVAGIALSFFLDFFVVKTQYTAEYIQIVFLIQLFASASSYFMSYKRNLLYVDQKQYISTFIDTIFNIFFTVLRILVLKYISSYIVYLCLLLFQTVLSNVAITKWCNRNYPFLKDKVSGKYDKIDILKINLKNILIGKVGAIVYSSTDNLIISKFVSITAVGLISNYYQINLALKAIASSITRPIQPMIGNYLREYDDVSQSYKLFLNYTFVRYCLANVLVVGTIFMMNPIIEIWLGKEYQLPILISVLLALDLFIGTVHGPAVEYIAVLGLFKSDRNMSIIGALINLGLSLVGVRFIGMAGVLLGTVVAQTFYWIARSYIVYKYYFKRSPLQYISKIILYIGNVIFELTFISYISNKLQVEMNIYYFVLGCLFCIIVCLIFTAAMFGRTNEFAFLLKMLKRNFVKNHI